MQKLWKIVLTGTITLIHHIWTRSLDKIATTLIFSCILFRINTVVSCRLEVNISWYIFMIHAVQGLFSSVSIL